MHAAHKSSVQSTPTSRSVAMPEHRLQPIAMPLSMNVPYSVFTKYCIIKIIHLQYTRAN